MIASRPWTPVVAAEIGSVPLYHVPVMPTLPVDQYSRTSESPVAVVSASARPLSGSMTALGPSFSFVPPTVGQPCESPVPADSEWMTAKPRGTHVLTSLVEIEVLVPL